MKKKFPTRLAAIDWLANNCKTEGQFEVQREQLLYKYLYTKKYEIDSQLADTEVVLIDPTRR